MNLSNNAIQVLEKRYLVKNSNGDIIETPEEMFSRVARTIAGAECHESMVEYEDKFYKVMTNLEFLPNSPTLINAGRELGQLSACFVLPIDDSMESIFTTLRDAALIQKSGGGTGFSFSSLRPKGDTVKSTQKCAGGPVDFICIFDRALDVIRQGGVRHGANMAILRVDHPDIESFIDCKKIEGSIPNFNISVGITDEFMNAVRRNDNFDLINPRSGQVTRTVQAVELFDKIVYNAWANGEPGLVFLDHINSANMIPHAGQIEATNPCIHGDSLISTTEGEIPIQKLAEHGGIVDVYSQDKHGEICIKPARFFKTKTIAEIIEVVTSKGIIKCTKDHKIMTPKGWVEAQHLRPKQRLTGLNKKKHNERYLSINVTGGKYHSESRLIAEYYYGSLIGKDVHHLNGDMYDNRISNLQVLPHATHSIMSNLGNNNHATRDNKGQFIKIPNKKKKSKNLNQGSVGTNWYVIDIRHGGYAAVYDGNVDDTHRYVANGILLSNCGEQPLFGYESCNLGSINLGRMIKTGDIDWDRLSYVVQLAVRFLDNVIDMNRYPITQIETKTKASRKIGLGVMGFADMLIKLDMQYDTEEACQLAGRVMKFIRDTAIRSSEILAETRGVFPLYRGSIWHTEQGIRLRNASLTTVAPTGTLSILANCSSGIEPYYSKTIKKHILNTILEEEVEFAKSDCFITAHDVAPEWHVKMQAVFQKHVCSAVSKTINFPNEATIGGIKRAYLLAHKSKCKGLTVYRDGSRDVQVLTSDNEEERNNGCPECGESIIQESGCEKCSSCGWSACAIA